MHQRAFFICGYALCEDLVSNLTEGADSVLQNPWGRCSIFHQPHIILDNELGRRDVANFWGRVSVTRIAEKSFFFDVNSPGFWPQYGKTAFSIDEERSKPIYDLLRTISCTPDYTRQAGVSALFSANQTMLAPSKCEPSRLTISSLRADNDLILFLAPWPTPLDFEYEWRRSSCSDDF